MPRYSRLQAVRKGNESWVCCSSCVMFARLGVCGYCNASLLRLSCAGHTWAYVSTVPGIQDRIGQLCKANVRCEDLLDRIKQARGELRKEVM